MASVVAPAREPASASPATGRRTVGSCLKSRCNNFDAIRLVAAFLVLFSHSFPLSNRNTEPLRDQCGWATFGELAVAVFFVISGMLVARSYLVDPNPISFLRKRSLRIFPGLIACVAFCVLVVGPLFTTLPKHDYFANRMTLLFARNAVLYPNHYELPGVFQNDDIHQMPPAGNAVDGSLWTLPIEFFMYLCVMALGMTGLLKRWPVVGLVLALAAYMLFAQGRIIEHHKNYEVWLTFVPLFGLCYFLGTTVLMFKDQIVLDWRLFVIALLAPILTLHYRLNEAVLLACLPYVILYVAFAPLPWFSGLTRWGDFSYGVYLYAYPVQQMVWEMARGEMNFWLFVAVSSVLTLALAIVSWRLVERPMLKLKKRATHDAAKDNRECATGVVASGALASGALASAAASDAPVGAVLQKAS